MTTHVKVLGVLYIALSAFFVCAALFLGFAVGAGGLAAAGGDADARAALPFIGFLGSVAVVFLLALAVPGIVTGIGLLKFKPWARIVGIVLAVLNLINIPFGTVLGIYGMWVLFNKDTERLFATPPGTVTPV